MGVRKQKSSKLSQITVIKSTRLHSSPQEGLNPIKVTGTYLWMCMLRGLHCTSSRKDHVKGGGKEERRRRSSQWQILQIILAHSGTLGSSILHKNWMKRKRKEKARSRSALGSNCIKVLSSLDHSIYDSEAFSTSCFWYQWNSLIQVTECWTVPSETEGERTGGQGRLWF